MRIPVLPTLIVAAAVAVMLGLGVWQLQRAAWKERLIAELESTATERRASVTCTIEGKPEVRAGRSARGETGYRYLIPCRPTEEGLTLIDAGWSKRPDALPYLPAETRFTGTYAISEAGARRTLVLDSPIPPLQASALPSAADLPNNHLLYAVQWFFFAGAAAVIYILALRRRHGAAASDA